MSSEAVGKKVYTNIDDLPLIQSISDGDKFILQTDDGTQLLDFYNFKVDLEHTTFESTFNEIIEFTSTASDYIASVDQTISDMNEKVSDMQTEVAKIDDFKSAFKFLTKAMLGAYNSSSSISESYTQAFNNLSTEAQTLVTEILLETCENNSDASYTYVDEETPASETLAVLNFLNFVKKSSVTTSSSSD